MPSRPMHRVLAAFSAVGLALLAAPAGEAGAGPSPDRAEPSAFIAGPCVIDGVSTPAGPLRCGTVSVPLHHDAPDAGQATLAVAVLPAAQDGGETPLVVLAGGPGEKLVEPAVTSIAASSADPSLPPNPFLALAERRDVVLVDQRGVGLSSPNLDCPEVFNAIASAASTEQLQAAALAAYGACRDRLDAQGVDLTAFNTTENAADIDRLRAALGYEQIDVFGTSYGARLALQVARDHAAGLRRLVLSSPVPAERNFILEVGPSYDRALQRLDHECSVDPGCNERAPDLLATFEQVLWQLTRSPAAVPFTDPATGEAVTLPLDAFSFDSLVYSLFYGPGGPELVPAIIAAAAQGDFTLVTRLVATPPPVAPEDAQPTPTSPVSHGMQASFLCSEEAPAFERQGPPSVQTYAAELLVANNPILGPRLTEVCEVWGVPAAPATVFEPIVTEVPTLVVTGRFDQITPPGYGLEVAAALPRDLYVEVASAGHSPLFNAGPCGLSLLEQFLAERWWELDASCAATPPQFYLPPETSADRPTQAAT